jgi:peptide/nickel transport system substrate-binding protein
MVQELTASVPEVRPRRGGILRIRSLGDMDYLDPQRTYYTCSHEVLRCVVRSLMTYPGLPNPEGARIVPDLAEDYPEISADRTTYTFRLREGIRFGPPVDRPVRASDVKFGLERLLDPEILGRVHGYFKDIVGAEDVIDGRTEDLAGVTCPDDRTIVIRLVRPLGDFVHVCALPACSPVPPEVARVHKTDYSHHVVATGPYYIETYRPDDWLHLVRNPSWDARTDEVRSAWVDELDIQLNVSWAQILEEIENDEADLPAIANPTPEDIKRYVSDPKFAGRWHADAAGCIHYISLNCTVPPLDDVRVRQAITYAMDKQALRDVRGGEVAGDIATTVLPPTLVGHRSYDIYPTPDHRGDVAKARALLAEAGLPDGFKTWCLVVSNGFGPEIGRVIRESLGRAGIEVEVREVAPGEYFKHLGTPANAVPIGGNCGYCPDWPGNGARSYMSVLFDGRKIKDQGTANFAMLDDPDVNRLIDEAESASEEEAAQRWGELDRRIMERAPIIPWIYDNHMTLISSRLRNYFNHAFLVGPDWSNVWLAE